MPVATSSSADAKPNGDAKSREKSSSSEDGTYTVEQKAAVLRVKRCGATAFYDILGLEEVKKTVTDGEIKKAYRKLSLLTHPDKNRFPGADEAFKLVSRAFQILSDADKKSRYDKFGGDPDNRFGPGSGPSTSSPFSGFGRTPTASRAGPMWEDEISPEEMFNRFFGGGGIGGGMGSPFGPFGGGGFATGPQYVFNLGGGPGVRIHHFGGSRPRRRPREANDPEERPPTLRSTLSNLLPLLVLFILPLLSTLFSSESSTSAGPSMHFDFPAPPLTLHRTTPKLRVNYYVNPKDISEWSSRKLNQLDQRAEVNFVSKLRTECAYEIDLRNRKMQEAQGWFFQDTERMREAREMHLKNCRRLDELSLSRRGF